MEKNYILQKLKDLKDEGEAVKATVEKRENTSVIDLTPYQVNNRKFVKWQTKSITFLEKILDSKDFHLKNFKEKVKNNYEYEVVEGLAIIESLMEDIEEDNFKPKINLRERNSDEIIENILNNFHRVVRQLRIRHGNRQTIEINDEYDVQDLLHALLLINFNDIRPEEWTPSYAGSSSRMDFLIKNINTVIETKMTRENLKDKKIGEELIIDKDNYFKHPDCDKLYCFVYDPKELIKNPAGLENDLSEKNNEFEVKVIIIPKF